MNWNPLLAELIVETFLAERRQRAARRQASRRTSLRTGSVLQEFGGALQQLGKRLRGQPSGCGLGAATCAMC